MRANYFVSETANNLRRNVLMTVAAISTVAISLLLLGGARILNMVITNVTYSWEAKVEISAFLQDNAAEGEIQDLQTDLANMPEVQSIEFVSSADAFEEFKQLYRNRPEFVEPLDENSLPASLRVKLTDAKYTEVVADRIEGAPGLDSVSFGGEIIKRLLQVNALLRAITYALSIVLMVAAIALIGNTIRLAIYARREEIGIMKLVGATNWFIVVPFMFEGIFAGLVGAVISGAIVWGANELLFARMGDFLSFLGPVFTFSSSEIAGVLLLLVGAGVVVGLAGSLLSLRRFLEV